MSELRQRMTEDLQLRGLSERTQQAYVGAVAQLAKYYHRSPDTISEEELRRYFLYLKNEKEYSRSSSTISLCGIKFFYENTVKRDWPTLSFVRAPREHKLPVVLSRDEVRGILAQVARPRYRACLSTIYSCGLRLQEGTRLQIPDIDGGRRLIHLHRGKGKKDRYVPLPARTLELLREHWKTHRNKLWLFPAIGRGGIGAPTATKPMPRSSLQIAFKKAVRSARVHKRVSVHTLRHYVPSLTMSGDGGFQLVFLRKCWRLATPPTMPPDIVFRLLQTVEESQELIAGAVRRRSALRWAGLGERLFLHRQRRFQIDLRGLN